MNPVYEIVVIEDNPADFALVQEALKEHHVECLLHPVRDGAKALELIESLDSSSNVSHVDLFILDMHLPKHDGEEILKRICATENCGQTPIVVMAAFDSNVAEATAARPAALVYFPKPSTIDEFMKLGSIVRTLLQETHQTAQRPEKNAQATRERR